MKIQKTTTPKIQSKADKKWFIIDAQDQILGKIATQVAVILRGKNKPSFTPHLDMGDYVVITNAEKIKLSGNKESQKEYITHSGYLGHIKKQPFKKVQAENPKRILQEAIAGMIPNNRLKKFIIDKLFIYAGEQHPHAGQNPIEFKV